MAGPNDSKTAIESALAKANSQAATTTDPQALAVINEQRGNFQSFLDNMAASKQNEGGLLGAVQGVAKFASDFPVLSQGLKALAIPGNVVGTVLDSAFGTGEETNKHSLWEQVYGTHATGAGTGLYNAIKGVDANLGTTRLQDGVDELYGSGANAKGFLDKTVKPLLGVATGTRLIDAVLPDSITGGKDRVQGSGKGNFEGVFNIALDPGMWVGTGEVGSLGKVKGALDAAGVATKTSEGAVIASDALRASIAAGDKVKHLSRVDNLIEKAGVLFEGEKLAEVQSTLARKGAMSLSAVDRATMGIGYTIKGVSGVFSGDIAKAAAMAVNPINAAGAAGRTVLGTDLGLRLKTVLTGEYGSNLVKAINGGATPEAVNELIVNAGVGKQAVKLADGFTNSMAREIVKLDGYKELPSAAKQLLSGMGSADLATKETGAAMKASLVTAMQENGITDLQSLVDASRGVVRVANGEDDITPLLAVMAHNAYAVGPVFDFKRPAQMIVDDLLNIKGLGELHSTAQMVKMVTNSVQGIVSKTELAAAQGLPVNVNALQGHVEQTSALLKLTPEELYAAGQADPSVLANDIIQGAQDALDNTGHLQGQATLLAEKTKALAAESQQAEALFTEGVERGLLPRELNISSSRDLLIPKPVQSLQRVLRGIGSGVPGGIIPKSKDAAEVAASFGQHASILDSANYELQGALEAMEAAGPGSKIILTKEQIDNVATGYVSQMLEGNVPFTGSQLIKDMFKAESPLARTLKPKPLSEVEKLAGVAERQPKVVNAAIKKISAGEAVDQLELRNHLAAKIKQLGNVSTKMRQASDALNVAANKAERFALLGEGETRVLMSDLRSTASQAAEDSADFLSTHSASIDAAIASTEATNALHSMLVPHELDLVDAQLEGVRGLSEVLMDPLANEEFKQAIESKIKDSVKQVDELHQKIAKNIADGAQNPDALIAMNMSHSVNMKFLGNSTIIPGSQMARIMEDAFKPVTSAQLGGFSTFVSKHFTTVWKSMAQGLPGSGARNLGGGMIQNLRSGAVDFAAGHGALWGEFWAPGLAVHTAKHSADPAVREIGLEIAKTIPKDVRKIMANVMENGYQHVGNLELGGAVAQNTSALGQFIRKNMTQRSDQLVAGTYGRFTRALHGGGFRDLGVDVPKVGVEFHNRGMANFSRQLAGESRIEASRIVDAVHFDYSDVQQWQANARATFLPFLTFRLKNAPLQLNLLMRNPATYRLEVMASQASTRWEQIGFDPKGSNGLVYHLPLDHGGNMIHWTNNVSPSSDLFETAGEFDGGLPGWKMLLNSSSPIIKALASVQTKKNLANPDQDYSASKPVQASWGKIPYLGEILGNALAMTGNAQVNNGVVLVKPEMDAAINEMLPTLRQLSRLGDSKQGKDPGRDRNLILNWMSVNLGMTMAETLPGDAAALGKSIKSKAMSATAHALRDAAMVKEISGKPGADSKLASLAKLGLLA